MKENERKCYKCGCSPSQDPNITLYRFPKPGRRNSLRCELWAKYCFPHDSWSSPEFQSKLHSRHLMLCTKHFKRSSFIDNSGKRLVKSAAPDEECNQITLADPYLDQTDVIQPIADPSVTRQPLPLREDIQNTIANPKVFEPIAGPSKIIQPLYIFEMSDLLVLDTTPTSPPISPPTPPPSLFCICCLQIEVPLISLLRCSHAEFVNSLMIPEIEPHDKVVCYECHEMLKKIKLFKLQVQESFKLLSGSSTENTQKCCNLIQNLTVHQTLKLDIPQTSSKGNLKTINNTEERLYPKSSQNQDKKAKNIEEALKIINANQNNGSFNILAPSLQSISHSLITDIYTEFQLNKTQRKRTELNIQAQINTNNGTGIGKNKNTEDEMVIKEKRRENIDLDVRNEEGYQSGIEKDDSMDVCESVLTDATDAPFDSNVILLTLSEEELSQERVKLASLPAYVHAKYRCKSCLIGFQFKKNLADHVMRKHTLKNKQSSLKCGVCSQFVRRDVYNVHTSRHYNRYQCISCGEQFCSYENAAVHHRKQHIRSGVTEL